MKALLLENIHPEAVRVLEEAGLVFSGLSPDRHLVEFAELSDHLILGHALRVGLAELRAHPIPEDCETHPERLPVVRVTGRADDL